MLFFWNWIWHSSLINTMRTMTRTVRVFEPKYGRLKLGNFGVACRKFISRWFFYGNKNCSLRQTCWGITTPTKNWGGLRSNTNQSNNASRPLQSPKVHAVELKKEDKQTLVTLLERVSMINCSSSLPPGVPSLASRQPWSLPGQSTAGWGLGGADQGPSHSPTL